LFGSKFKQKTCILEDGARIRFILTQTIKTNGKELQLHAIDTNSQKKQPVTSNTSIVDSAKLATKSKPFKFDKMEPLDYDDDRWIDLGQRYLAGVCVVKGSETKKGEHIVSCDHGFMVELTQGSKLMALAQ
jgi:hypothetical protein